MPLQPVRRSQPLRPVHVRHFLLVAGDRVPDLLLLTQFLFIELGIAGFRRVAANNQVADNRVIESKRAFQFFDGFLTHFHIHKNVVSFVDFGDGVCELASAPIFRAVNNTVPAFDDALVPFDHTGDLIALIRVH